MIRHPRTVSATLVAVGLVAALPLLVAPSGTVRSATPEAEAPATEAADAPAADAPADGAEAAHAAADAVLPRPTSSTAVTDPWVPGPEAAEVPHALSPEGFRVAQGDGPVVGTYGEVRTYTVEVEPMTGVELGAVLPFVRRTLEDADRGWTSHGEVQLQWTDDVDEADVRVVIARPETVDRHCAEVDLETYGVFSCWDGERTMLNAWRWQHGATDFRGDLATYRTYLVNHEVGHALGRTHLECPSPGEVAPIMMQQTVTTGECEPNGWPWP